MSCIKDAKEMTELVGSLPSMMTPKDGLLLYCLYVDQILLSASRVKRDF